ncbi:MAG: hypothetical protein IIC29_00215 [Chloroflexi bacterium]|nr:hypothetical protein [Chloroflexota bacterium]
MALEFVRHADGAAFLRHAEAFLLRNEAENGLTLGVAAMTPPGSDGENLWASVSDVSDVVATAFQTPPYYKVVVTAGPNGRLISWPPSLMAPGSLCPVCWDRLRPHCDSPRPGQA